VVFWLFSLITGLFDRYYRRWDVIFVHLCVILVNLGYSFSQVWSSVDSVMREGIPVIAFIVKVFVYCFALLCSPDIVFTESEECISSLIGWVIALDHLDFGVVFSETKVASDQVFSGLFTRPNRTFASTSHDEV